MIAPVNSNVALYVAVSSVPPDCSRLVMKPEAEKDNSPAVSVALLNLSVNVSRFSHAVHKSVMSLFEILGVFCKLGLIGMVGLYRCMSCARLLFDI